VAWLLHGLGFERVSRSRHRLNANGADHDLQLPCQFDLRGPADGFHRSADRAGGTRRLRWCC